MTGAAALARDVTLSAGVLFLVGAAGAALTRRVWAGTPALAPLHGLLAIGAAGLLCFFAFLPSPALGVLGARAIAVAAAAVVVGSAWTSRRLLAAAWRAVLPPALLMCGFLLVVVSLFALWRHEELTWFQLARIRFSHDLSTDNEIPSFVAVRLLEGGDPRTAPGGDWRSSDRPPLQTGLLLLVRAVAGWAGSGTTDLDLATGVVVQSLWVVAAFALLRVLGASARTGAVATVFAGASGTVLVNTVFTWPKLLSAAFLLAATAVVLQLPRLRHPASGLAAAGLLVSFGMLSHGAAAFALPVLLWALNRVRGSLSLGAAGVAGAVSALAYLPWLLYQRLYDPPGDRLLKWHLAGVIPPTERSFGQTLVDAYTGTPLATLLQDKVGNLAHPFSELPLAGLSAVLSDPSGRRSAEFYIFSAAVGLGFLALGYLVAAAVRARRAGDATDGFLRVCTGLLLAVAAGQVLWSLALFPARSAFVHHGSHLPVLLLLLLPYAVLARRRPVAAVALLVAQVALLLVTYAPGHGTAGPMSPVAVALGLAGVAALGVGVASARPDGTAPPAPSPAPPRDPADDDARPVRPGVPAAGGAGSDVLVRVPPPRPAGAPQPAAPLAGRSGTSATGAS